MQREGGGCVEDFSASEILRLDSVSEREGMARGTLIGMRGNKLFLWERRMMRNSYSGDMGPQ